MWSPGRHAQATWSSQLGCGNPFKANSLAGSQLKMPLLGLVISGTSTKPLGVALTSVKQFDPGSVAFPGFTGACRPAPVQFLTAAALAMTQSRVRLEPHALADCAHRSQADMELIPRDLGLAPF